jgi:hypothetical protein
VDRYDELTRRSGGSRSRLLRRIGASALRQDQSLPAGDFTRYCEQLFQAAAGLTGRYSDAWLAVHIYEPSGQDRARLVQTRAHGLLGHRARREAVPLTIHVFGSKDETAADVTAGPPADAFVPLERPNGGDLPATLLTRFSSKPPPVVRARHSDSFLVHAVDLGVDPEEHTVCDLLFGMYGEMVHPAHTPARAEEVWALINFPARRMLFDVFLHRELARACVPGVDVHLWGPDFNARAGERWQTRFAVSPRLEVLGQGIGNAGADANPRHGELLGFMFEKRGLDPADFVGFRCREEFPMWRTGYRMCFDFGDSSPPVGPVV